VPALSRFVHRRLDESAVLERSHPTSGHAAVSADGEPAGTSFFRSDFLARFPVRVRLPPLRERREDIALLARHFVLRMAEKSPEVRERFCRQGAEGRRYAKLSGRLIDALVRHPLPGNARDLEALLLEAVGASEGDELRLSAAALSATPSTTPPAPRPAKTAPGSAPPSGTPSREDIVELLRREDGNVARVARRLGIERTKLYRLMEEYGIKRGSGD
jgi:DNA-binding NtrC family response regulator